MLSAKDNEFISRIGPGTAMGEWLRRFWTPMLLSSELPEPDGEPKEVRILGENLVAFRDSNGRVGVIDALCPHRQAPLVLGRNEEQGLRCIYHGWKFDAESYCVDMPSEPADSVFKDKVRAGHYRTAESAGVIWIYMGPQHLQPEMPDMEWMRVPDSHRNSSRFNLEGNWVQAMEGDVDSSHVPFLHGMLRRGQAPAWATAQSKDAADPYPSMPGNYGPADNHYLSLDKAPRWIVKPTDFGMLIAARRNAEEDTYYWRINQIMFPYYTLVAGSLDQNAFFMHIWVPSDDTHTNVWTVMWRIHRPMDEEERAAMYSGPSAHLASYDPTTGTLRASKANHFFQDRQVQKTQTFSGIPGIREQDGAVTLGMGPIVDRTKEHLGTSDTAVIAIRRLLMREARALQDGKDPYAPYHGDAYRNRAWSAVLKRNDDFLNDPEVQRMHESLVP